MKWILFLGFASVALLSVSGKSYGGYKVYQIISKTMEQAESLRQKTLRFDFWKESKSLGVPSDVMVPPEDQEDFENALRMENFDFKVVVDNVERLIGQERLEQALTRASLDRGDVTFSSYMFYGEQMAYMQRLAVDHSNLVTVEKIGESYEGRDILIAKVSSGESGISTPKPTIFIDAGIHCREWIATPVALYILQQLVENRTNSAMYENVDWVILPNLNPDGYEFTQTNDRLWRKNRRPSTVSPCYGTDLNRNFGYYWMHDGASDDPCSDLFGGSSAFSEPESQVLRDYILRNQNIKLYLSFHSFGAMILYPWGYDTSLPDDYEELQSLGELAGKAIDDASQISSAYVVNTSARHLYTAAGGSDDWAKGVAGIELSYTIELPEGDAPFWFMLPARQILPVVRETFEGIRVYHQHIEDKFWFNLIINSFKNSKDPEYPQSKVQK